MPPGVPREDGVSQERGGWGSGGRRGDAAAALPASTGRPGLPPGRTRRRTLRCTLRSVSRRAQGGGCPREGRACPLARAGAGPHLDEEDVHLGVGLYDVAGPRLPPARISASPLVRPPRASAPLLARRSQNSRRSPPHGKRAALSRPPVAHHRLCSHAASSASAAACSAAFSAQRAGHALRPPVSSCISARRGLLLAWHEACFSHAPACTSSTARARSVRSHRV